MSKKTILEEAMEDTKLLKETAIENAKNVLVEAISPKIREFVDGQIGDGIAEMPAYEDHDMGMDYDDEEDEEKDEGFLAFEAKDENEDDDDENMEEVNDEVVEITSEDLQQALSELIRTDLTEKHSYQSGPDVSPGFADEENPNLNAKGGLGEKTAPGDRGLEDKEKEEMWKDAEAPAASDWTVKEARYRKHINALASYAKALKTENAKYKKVAGFLKRNLEEVNLFNSKLLYTQKLLQNTNLDNTQRVGVIEAFDRAESLREVELVYKSLSESLKIAGALVEGQTGSKKPRSSRLTASGGTTKILEEQVSEVTGENNFSKRMKTLAGLID